MSDPDWGRSARSGLFWSAVGLLGNKAVNFLSVLVLARLLTPEDFGVVAAIMVFLSFIELGSDLGMKATVVYEQEEGITPRVQSAFTLNLLIAVILCVLGVACAPLVADFFGVEGETWLFRLGALSLLLAGLGNIHDSLLLRGLAFKRRVIPGVVRALIRGVVAIWLALEGAGAEALVFGMLAGGVGWTVTQWIVSPFMPDFSLDRRIVRSMAAYGGAAALLEVLAVLNNRADQVIIGRVLGERALGLFTIAFRVPELLIETVAWNTSQVAFPALSRKRAVDYQGLARATLQIVHYQSLYAIPVATGIAVCATPLIVVLFGDQWESAGGVTAGVAVAMGIGATIFPLGDVFKALGRQRVLVVMNLVNLPLIVFAVLLAADSGIVAVAWARAGTRALFAAALIMIVLRTVKADFRSFARAIAPALIASVGVLLGAGAVRLAWDANELLPLLAAVLAGLAGGLLSLRLFVPSALADLRDQIRATIPGRNQA